jgi:hypothetical protein
MEQFNREEVEKFFEFLNHGKFTEVRIIGPREGLKEVSFVDNLNDFLAIAEKWNGKANVYVGVNERFTKEGKAEHVNRLSIIPIDIDPVRLKDQASTEAELKIAYLCMLAIKKWLKENFDCTPFTSMSGNGYHIFIKILPQTLTEFSRPVLQQKLEIFVHGIQDEFNNEKIHIDSTFDLPRVMKCPGTLSVKGDNTSERPWRMCQIFDDSDIPSAGVLNHLITLEKPEKAEVSFKVGDKGNKEFNDLLQKDEKLRDLMEGQWEKYKFKSRSEAEQSIVTKLMINGFSEESVRIVMNNCKIGKWQKSPEAYRKKCIQKAIQFVTDHIESAIEPTQYIPSCGEDLSDKIFEQISGNKYIVYDKTTGNVTIQNTVDNFVPIARLIWTQYPSAIREYNSEIELWTEVKKFIYDHVDILEGYDILTAWVLASWIPEIWDSVPYLFFFGPKGSGKSRAMKTLGALGFRSMLCATMTLPAVFRVTEAWRPTLFFDETENYLKADRGEIINILNAGYQRGWYAIRMEETKDGGYEPKSFNVFGFKAIGGTKDMVDTLKSRCIIFNMSKAVRPVRKKIDKERANEIQEKLLLYRFRKLTKRPPEEDIVEFTDRLSELFTPLVNVAPTSEKQVIITEGKKIERELEEEEEASLESMVFNAIWKIHDETQDDKILIADVEKIVNEILDVREMISAVIIGRIVRRLGFHGGIARKEGRRGRILKWDNAIAKRLMIRYGKRETQRFINDAKFRRGVSDYLNWGRDNNHKRR